MTDIQVRELVMPEVDGWRELVTPYAMNYKSSWNSAWFTVREIMQNALDEHDDAGIEERPKIRMEEGNVIIEDVGRGVGVDCLLMREVKESNPKLRGIFGEGLKWACLCALRLGMHVNIRSPLIELEPFVARTPNFGGNGLSVDLMVFRWRARQDTGDQKEAGTTVTISNYQATTTFGSRFFPFLDTRCRFDSCVNNVTSTIGVSRRAANWLYVKDIYVRTLESEKDDQKSLFTYNLWDVELDPDRVQVRQSYMLFRAVSMIWGRCDQLDMIETLLTSMAARRWEAKSSYWDCSNMDHPGIWKAAWLKRYGSNAILSSHDQEVDNKARYYGMKIIDMPSNFVEFLKKAGVPEAQNTCDEIQAENHELVDEKELTYAQRANLAGIRWICQDYTSASGIVFRVADFASTTDRETVAQYHKGECLLRRSVLDDIWSALGVVCHEISHHSSGLHDGDPNLIFPLLGISTRMFRFIRRNRHASEWGLMVGNEDIDD